MSKLNEDILFIIFEELQHSSKFLFSCLMVNRLWCETAIPVLWRRPWHYAINYHNKSSLYSIITSCLSNDIKDYLTKKGIKISGQSLAFDYLSFCMSIDISIIDDIISIESSSEYDRFILQEEVYNFLIMKCPEIKYLNIRGSYELVFLPETKVRLESLCELTCDTSIDPKYFYRISHICQQIQRIIIINNNLRANYGAIKLIEFQKNLKYFKWEDDFNDDYFMELENPYAEIFHMLKRHANTLNHFEVSLQTDYDYFGNYIFVQYSILGLHNLKILKISSTFSSCDDFDEQLKTIAYRDLEVLDMEKIDIYQVTCIIKNSLCLRELRISIYNWDYDDFFENSLNFIRAICENCSLIEHLSIPVFPLLENHIIEFEKLLKKCQELRLLHFAETYYEEGKELDFGEYLSNVLIREASINLREVVIPYDIRFSLKTLETFFEKWKGRPAISILIDEPYFYQTDLYMKLINKYKGEGVIKYTNVSVDNSVRLFFK
ncbi:hypothetical protein RclHR1_01700003 [Rhizophagus clarus]|uniref:F-box domain-containing protein n=1 Tax=Rhizophagus clarus TaxID=94130 RepID=A0A2Z6QJ64_9GLOM|nr:hypothetical protein RclHR1_01700003 [Rhizophagus clarus]GES86376.1 hypothetical protein GLOIN_2v1764011 [Rhizophagus clarus]